MLIRVISPAPPGTLYGNRVTALRWARILRELGHRVTITGDYTGERCDLLIALHARKSARAALRFRKLHPSKPLVVALTGTDLYRDLRRSAIARRTLEAATYIVTLQPLATRELDPAARIRVRVIYQSAQAMPVKRAKPGETFDVCVVGHLRSVKDPFRTAYAARRLRQDSRVRVWHAGRAMTGAMAVQARAEQARNPRYHWLRLLSPRRVQRLIARSRLLVLSSRMEGGANVISEALVEGTPVIASCIPGSIGLLGEDYPGYFPVGDTEALARLIERAEFDPAFYRELERRCKRLAPLFRPAAEETRWRNLLREIAGMAAGAQTRK